MNAADFIREECNVASHNSIREINKIDIDFAVELMEKYHQAKLKLLGIANVVKSLPNDDEIEQAANEEATRIFDGTGGGSEWYARHHGFTDGVEWLKNYLAK